MMYIKTHHLLSFQLGDESRHRALPSETGGVHVCRADPDLGTHPGLCEKSKNACLVFRKGLKIHLPWPVLVRRCQKKVYSHICGSPKTPCDKSQRAITASTPPRIKLGNYSVASHRLRNPAREMASYLCNFICIIVANIMTGLLESTFNMH